ncbi:MAG: DinB family protein [Candidatus Dormibacteraeota bacterium]|nr:DinB family protein [Candidatus Dormibacteraeota bacterium]MBO0743852.1 DinB family protein [Candidatus Dormibacteraeota bacterium]
MGSDPERLDFRGRRLERADFSGARLHRSDFENAQITNSDLHNLDITAAIPEWIEGLRVNGVEVAPLVEAELDRLHPEHAKLRATDPDRLREAWAAVEDGWASTVARARTLPEPLLHRQVDGDWSFVETLRHLIFATDCWLFRAVRREPHPYHAWGIAGPWLQDPEHLGIDPGADPDLQDVLEVRRGRLAAVRETFAALTSEELARVTIPPDTPGHPPSVPHQVLQCLQEILNEEWWHRRYAERDLDALLGATLPRPG